MFQMMEGLSFLGKFICMTNYIFHEVGASFNVNGKSTRNFKPTRGFAEIAP